VVLLDAALQPLSIALGDLGIAWNWRIGPASAAPTDTIMQALAFTPNGRGLMPFSPTDAKLRREANGDLAIRWLRRDRALAADSWVLAQVPMSEASESYDLEIMNGATVVRTVTSIIAIPDRAIVLAVSTCTVAAVHGATSYDCGVSGQQSQFGGTLGVAAGSSNVGVIDPQAFYAPTPIVLTANGGSFTGGDVRVAIQYLLPTAPTV